jgi:hypothetical protein
MWPWRAMKSSGQNRIHIMDSKFMRKTAGSSALMFSHWSRVTILYKRLLAPRAFSARAEDALKRRVT